MGLPEAKKRNTNTTYVTTKPLMKDGFIVGLPNKELTEKLKQDITSNFGEEVSLGSSKKSLKTLENLKDIKEFSNPQEKERKVGVIEYTDATANIYQADKKLGELVLSYQFRTAENIRQNKQLSNIVEGMPDHAFLGTMKVDFRNYN